MVNISLLRDLYPNVDIITLSEYKPADEVIMFHENDRNLHPIEVNIRKVIEANFHSYHPDKPVPEELIAGFKPELWHKIDGFGLPAAEQKYQRPKIPKKLETLEKSCTTVEEIYEALNANPQMYSEELKWIMKQWHHRIYGYWCFINGKPTYHDGCHYFYLGFWHLDIGLPAYRSRDRKTFMFHRYAYTTTESVFRYRVEHNGEWRYTSNLEEVKEWKHNYGEENIENGFWIIDMGRRTVFGVCYPKYRREGATYRALCLLYEVISKMYNAKGGIQSMDDSHGEIAFKDKLIKPWRRLPFFFRPKTSSSSSPKKELNLEAPIQRSRTKGSVNSGGEGMDSYIDFATTADASYYDGDKLMFLYNDEVGKTTQARVHERWQVQKECLSQGGGSRIHGYTLATSTVEELTKKGGESFLSWTKDSHWENRDFADGQTKSGMINLFIPAYDGLEGYIDEFGESVIETPRKPTKNEFGHLIKEGAKEYLENKEKALLAAGDAKSLLKYYQRKRLFPLEWEDCFIASASDTGFNIKILSDRISELMMHERLQPVQGDFEWIEPFVSVKWVPSIVGKFYASFIPEPQYQNLIMEGPDGKKYPANPGKFISSADPFRFTKTEGYRMSNGGGATFWDFDSSVDEEKIIQGLEESAKRDIMKAKWLTNRFICDYNCRVDDKNLYAEDMLKMCIFYGSMMYPEINVTLIWDKFEEWGFGGYLLYDYDPIRQELKKTPGFSSTESKKQDLFLGLKQHIEEHGHRERHLNILRECKDISGLEEMTKYDVFTAAGGCLLGRKSRYSRFLRAHLGLPTDEEDTGSVDWSGFIL